MITLFHAGYEEIKEPDAHYGRKNADFGQGFYTTDDIDFASSWGRDREGADIIINRYELDDSALKVKRLKRDQEWFEYIFANRRVRPDIYGEYDLIVGPIANDTIYETMGIVTSGFLSDEEAMKLLMVGPCYTQTVLKTRKAVEHLRFISSEVLSKEQIEAAARRHSADEEKFQTEFAKVMEELDQEEG